MAEVGLSYPVQYLKGVGPARARQLARLSINTVADLLQHYPRRYEDRSTMRPISLAGFVPLETIRGTVVAVNERRVRQGLVILQVGISDGTGVVWGVWFNQPYLKQRFRRGTSLILSGRIERKFGQLQIENPEYEEMESEDDESIHTGRIVPIYGLTEGLPQKTLRSIAKGSVDRFAAMLPDPLDPEVKARHSFPELAESVREVHFPSSFAQLERARHRLVFDELLMIQAALAVRKQSRRVELKGYRHKPDGPLLERFVGGLPFLLTAAQRRVFDEIRGDMESPEPMNRLLQGDVGSGKTVVAAMALVKAVESGHQGAIMAPTEILAEQHFLNLNSLLSSAGARVALLTSGLSRKQKDLVLSALPAGEVDIVVGTHALIQEGVDFRSLGLVVVDEQHRFGVRQRAVLAAKGGQPDVLVMTATPIPRTLALTLYGDLDYSVIDEMPPGRKPVVTEWLPEDKKRRAYLFIREQVTSGAQAFVVCPLIEESEKLQAEAATMLAERLRRQVFRGIEVGLLHGRMDTEEKELVMNSFRSGKIQVLVSTSIIEVGVDVAGATAMLIEGADRFGLAQLHQLRGRVGRAERQSFCFLVCNAASPDVKRRMEVMQGTTDGFKIAEADLEIRGPGEFFGTRQHGMPDLKIANPLKDYQVLLEAREEAFRLIEQDPTLEEPAHAVLKNLIAGLFPEGMGLFTIS